MAAISADEKKKLFVLLGIAGVLFIAVVVIYFPKGSSVEKIEAPPGSVAQPVSQTTTPEGTTETPPTPEAGAGAGAPPPGPGAETGAATEGAPAATTAAAPTGGVRRRPPANPREDPFVPFYTQPRPPEPTPTPAPTLPPPLPVPPPEERIVLAAGRPISPRNAPPSAVLVGLPSPRIANYLPLLRPRSFPSSGLRGAAGGAGTPTAGAPAYRSPGKRLSGVVFGDSVRALLEIATDAGGAGAGEGGAQAEQYITRVVQPGDEVEGIKILRIERIFEGGRQVTRMYVSENGEERYVDLRPSPNPPAAATGTEGGEGVPAAPPPGGGFPGRRFGPPLPPGL